MPKFGRRIAEVQVVTIEGFVTGLALAEKPAFHNVFIMLTVSVLQACCAVTTEYGIPSDFVRKSTAPLKI